MTYDQTPDRNKFKELIVLVCRNSDGDLSFGATKLNKLLFFSDFIAYRKLGKAITGQRYFKLDNGPAPRALKPVLNELESERAVAPAERDRYGRTQLVTIALREPQLHEFSPEEVLLVTTLIHDWWGKSAKEMSDQSHRFIGWKLAENKEDIPYEVAVVKFGEQTGVDLKFATEAVIRSPELTQIIQENSNDG